MRVREFESVVATLTNWSESDIDQRTRRLRQMRMLPTGGRGLNAPDIRVDHAATIFIALAGAEKAVDAHRAVIIYAPMVAKNDSASGFDFLGCKTFGDALTAILEKSEIANRIEEIRVCRSWPEATITYKGLDGKMRQERYAPANKPAEGYGYAVRSEIIFSDGFISDLALSLDSSADEDDAGGWVGDEDDPLPRTKAAQEQES